MSLSINRNNIFRIGNNVQKLLKVMECFDASLELIILYNVIIKMALSQEIVFLLVNHASIGQDLFEQFI